MSEFKVGDRVQVSVDNGFNPESNGRIGILLEDDNSYNPYLIKFEDDYEGWVRTILKCNQKDKSKPDNLTRYMVYGTGCDNISNLMLTEPELKTELKKRAKDSEWTGRIIGYELVPLYEAELTTKLKVFKTVKIVKKKVVKKKKR